MTLSLKQSRAIADMSDLLYDFLPGSGNPAWKNHVSFRTVSQEVGVGDFWQAGSKRPMIVNLLEKTLSQRCDRFEPLLIAIVRAGMRYRQKQGNQITEDEIDQLNGLLLDIGFKFPQLWDTDFRASLRTSGPERAREHLDRALQEERIRETERERFVLEMEDLKRKFFELHDAANRQEAGRELESLLNRLFSLNGLAPRQPFRIVGEQIDGAFEFDYETYILEAKWESKPLSEAPLTVFRERVEQSKFTHGVFISVNGISEEAKEAITKRKQPNFFLVDGYDLVNILEGGIELKVFLRQRQRLLAEEGEIVVPFKDLYRGTRKRE